MKALLALKLTSDSLMVAEALSLKKVSMIEHLHLLTDRNYGTLVEGVEYHFLCWWVARIPILRVFARIPKMIWICRKEKIDVLICYHLTSYGFAGFVISKLLQLPLSIHFLGKDIDELCRSALIGPILLRFAKTIDCLTVQGTKSKDFLQLKGLHGIHIIPTACDLRFFRPSDKVDKAYDVIFVGRLGREKRIGRFVDIVYALHGRGYLVKAAVVGNGLEEKKMMKRINKFGLDRHIEYVGWTNKVADYLDQARIFLLTSENDQLPSSLLEAMAMGLVPVAADVGNVSDVVNQDSGFLIQKDDIDGYAKAVIALLEDPDLYVHMSQHCRKKAKEFSLEANSKRWEGLLSYIREKDGEQGLFDKD